MQSWLDHTSFDDVNKKVADRDPSDESSMGVEIEVDSQSQGTPLYPGSARPDLPET